MAEIVNLNKFRKARARVEDARKASENKVRHGRGKAEKRRDDDDRARREAEARRLESEEDSEQAD